MYILGEKFLAGHITLKQNPHQKEVVVWYQIILYSAKHLATQVIFSNLKACLLLDFRKTVFSWQSNEHLISIQKNLNGWLADLSLWVPFFHSLVYLMTTLPVNEGKLFLPIKALANHVIKMQSKKAESN